MNKHRIKFIILNFLFFMLIAAVVLGEYKQKNSEAASANVALRYIEQASERKEQQENIANLLHETIQEELPGIVVWGDSFTAGVEGNSMTIPLVLQNLIYERVFNNIPVENMGVSGESSNTLIGRTGSVPYVVNGFTIPADTSKVEIHLNSSNGSAVAPLVHGNRGVNPVTINGVQGIISTVEESYFFERLEGGEAVPVQDDTIVETAAFKDFDNFLPIISMGENGGYETNQQLVDQIKSIVNMEKSNEKYLVLGLTSGAAESRIELESLMASVFGEKYVNLRDLISTNGLQIAGITPTTEDLVAMEAGSIPPSLMADEVNLNAKGSEVIGRIVFERMQNLGYFDTVQKLAEELDAL